MREKGSFVISIEQQICDVADSFLVFDFSNNIQDGKDFITIATVKEKTECS